MAISTGAEVERTRAALAAASVDGVDDDGLRELLVSAEGLRNAAEALQAQVMVEMRDRAHRADIADDAINGTSYVPSGAREEFVADEVAVLLTCTRVAAGHRLATALAAADCVPAAEAWRAGRLDARKVAAIADQLTCGRPAKVENLADKAVAYAQSHTGPQLRGWLGRQVIAADPEAAEARRQQATAGQQVKLVPLPDGVAELIALMPASQARHLFDTLTAAAHATDGADARTLEQRRSDVLYDLATGRAEPPQIQLQVTVPAAVLAGQSNQPGLLAGYGPVTADTIRGLLGTTDDGAGPVCGPVVWRALVTDPATGVLTGISERQYRPSAQLDRAIRARDVTCRFPGCRRSALTARNGVDLDHTVPYPHGLTTAENLACLCRHHHRLKHSPDWQSTLHPDGAMVWTTPTGRTFGTGPWQYHPPDAEPPDAAPDDGPPERDP